MRTVRFSTGTTIKYGIIQNNLISGLKQDPFLNSDTSSSRFDLDNTTYSLDKVKLLAPCTPSKILGLGLNYKTHIDEMPPLKQADPIIFLKPPTAVIGPNDDIILPAKWEQVDYEGELGVVIGKKTRNVSEKDAFDYILGYTCFNDVTERALQRKEQQWTRCKGYDTFAPTGPWIETELNPVGLKIETYVNDKVVQSSTTDKLIFGIATIVSFISGIMTLLPGDIIATGTPGGIGPIKPGDIVDVRIEGIGILTNKVVNSK